MGGAAMGTSEVERKREAHRRLGPPYKVQRARYDGECGRLRNGAGMVSVVNGKRETGGTFPLSP